MSVCKPEIGTESERGRERLGELERDCARERESERKRESARARARERERESGPERGRSDLLEENLDHVGQPLEHREVQREVSVRVWVIGPIVNQ